MTEPSFVTHNGVRILVVDYRGAGGPELRERLEAAGRFIASQGDSSLILARVGGIEFSAESTKILLAHISDNEPYSLATAVVGLEHLEKVVPIANRLTGRDLVAFDDEKKALDWLASHAPPSPSGDESVRWIEHDGERILRIDFSKCGFQEIQRRIRIAASLIRNEPPRSVLGLNLVADIPFDRVVAAAMKDYVRDNRPYMLAAAAVGLGYMKAVIPPLNRLTGRNIRAFDDEASAKAWLINQKRRFAGLE